MKARQRSRTKTRVNLNADSFSLSHAKTYLGRLIEKAAKGETVYILRGQQRFLLQELPPIDPIPMRPSGYFANCDSKAEIDELNLLAKSSSIRPPNDLE
jgi:hypothetical protein